MWLQISISEEIMKKVTLIFKFMLILCTVYIAFVQVENVNAETLRTKIVVAQKRR